MQLLFLKLRNMHSTVGCLWRSVWTSSGLAYLSGFWAKRPRDLSLSLTYCMAALGATSSTGANLMGICASK